MPIETDVTMLLGMRMWMRDILLRIRGEVASRKIQNPISITEGVMERDEGQKRWARMRSREAEGGQIDPTHKKGVPVCIPCMYVCLLLLCVLYWLIPFSSLPLLRFDRFDRSSRFGLVWLVDPHPLEPIEFFSGFSWS